MTADEIVRKLGVMRFGQLLDGNLSCLFCWCRARWTGTEYVPVDAHAADCVYSLARAYVEANPS